jgi:hypothetical protein
MSTFTCQELANAFNWGACACEHSPMPIFGSVTGTMFPYSTFGWSPQNKSYAKSECCEIACEIAQNANPISPFEPVGQMGGLTPSGTGRKPSGLVAPEANRKKGFRGQSGGGIVGGPYQVDTSPFYEAGVQAAQAAFQAGGVNALLSFLAGFNSGH